jgi:hypothetical protein
MPSPKSGKVGSAVTPADPDAALEADNAVAGSLDQTQANSTSKQAGAEDSVKIRPDKRPQSEEEKEQKQSWIEIEMTDEDKNPVPGRAYLLLLPDGQSVAGGTLDDKGFARVEGIEPGTCKISFPNLDQEAWERI